MTGVAVGLMMPDGSKCSAYDSSPDHHRVACVVAAVETRDVIDLGADQIGSLALAFVTPLCTDQHDSRHSNLRFGSNVAEVRLARALEAAVSGRLVR